MQRRTVLLIPSDACGWSELRATLAAMAETEIVGEATMLDEARDLAASLQPAFIIAAGHVGGVSVVPLLTEIHAQLAPASVMVVIAPRFDPGELRALPATGVTGYLLWSDLPTPRLRPVLTAIVSGDLVVASRDTAAALLGRAWEPAATVHLTDRERLVLRRLDEGLTEKEIARAEGLGLRSVERTVRSLEAKLDARSLPPGVEGGPAGADALRRGGGIPPRQARKPAKMLAGFHVAGGSVSDQNAPQERYRQCRSGKSDPRRVSIWRPIMARELDGQVGEADYAISPDRSGDT